MATGAIRIAAGRSGRWFALAVALFAARASTAAEPIPASDAEVRAKLGRIEAALDRGEGYAKLWWDGWLGIFGAGAVGSGILSLAAPTHDKPVWRIGALRSTLGIASEFVVAFPAAHGPEVLRAMPESTPEERLLKLLKAQHTLREAAAVERLNRSWLAHTLNIAVNGAFSLWIWRGYHQPGAAALSFGTGLLASEAKIFTSPTQAIEDEEALLAPRENLAQNASRSSVGSQSFGSKLLSQVAIAPMPGGLMLAGKF